MNTNQEFIFRDKLYECSIFIDSSIDPCFVFVEFKDMELTRRFGNELTIKTDFEKVLPFGDRDPDYTELRQAILLPLRSHPEFVHARLKREARNLVAQFNQAHG